MLPALEQLAAINVLPYPSCVGLTGLRALSLCETGWGLEAAEWDALEAMPQLTELEVDLDPRETVQLSGLGRLTNLGALKATITAVDPYGEVPFDVGAVLEAVARLPLLHTAQIEQVDSECELSWGWGGLRRFVHGAPALCHLSIQIAESRGVPAWVVGALAMHTGLRRLLVDCAREESGLVKALAAEGVGECGSLTIRLHSACLVQVCGWRENEWDD
jgi:hypothetical protein